MNFRKNNIYLAITAILTSAALSTSCSNEVESNAVVEEPVFYDEDYFLTSTDTVVTGSTADVTCYSATIYGKLNNIDDLNSLPSYTTFGVVLSATNDRPVPNEDLTVASKTKTQIFSSIPTGLRMNTKYYYRAYFQTSLSQEPKVGHVMYFTTASTDVVANNPSALTCFSVTLNGSSGINLKDSKFTGECGVLYTKRQTNTPNATVDTFQKGSVASATADSTSFSVDLDNLEPGTKYTYQMYIKVDTNYYYSSATSFTTNSLNIADHDSYVDMGLSKMWAARNVGASNASDAGTYFAWSDPTGELFSFDLDDYMTEIGGALSTIIGTDYDMATQNMGAGWQLPSFEDYQELVNNCRWNWTTYNDVQGYVVTSNYTGNMIFFPAVGFLQLTSSGTNLVGNGNSPMGRYWTGNLYDAFSDYAYCLYFTSSRKELQNKDYKRYNGYTVRAVLAN